MKKLRIPIAVKLVSVTTLLLLLATVSIVLRSSNRFEDSSSKREGDTSLEQAQTLAAQVEARLQTLFDKTKVVGGILYKHFPNPVDRETALDLSFRSDRDLVAVEVWAVRSGVPVVTGRVVNESYLKQYDLKSDFIENLHSVKPFPINTIFSGDFDIRNSTIEGGAPLVAIGVPLVKNDMGAVGEGVVAYVRQDGLQKIFASGGARINFLVDREGHVLAHPDEKLAISGKKVDALPIVTRALTQNVSQFQTTFDDPESGESYVGAYVKTPFNVTVISQVPEYIILEPSRNVRRESFMITGMVLSAAFFFIILFSTTLTRPLEILANTTAQVAKGNFNIKAQIKTKDEVGELAAAFDSMIDGLKERDKVKTLFNKFHGTGVASKLIGGEMKLGGEQREATVFFSDIRSFTSFSEKHTAQEVVKMLNEYFKVMVSIVQKHHGVVDKFIGDAIMAVWGAPESFGNDALNAINACIEMRRALAVFNDIRLQQNLPEIRIGMGVHTGQLIAGTVGSDDRMEYTVIGDTVNLASRIEAATKAYGTDLLISEETCMKVQSAFTFEEAGTASVKGKEKPLKFFKVTGYIDANGQAVPVQTKYSSYEAEDADKVHKEPPAAAAAPSPVAAAEPQPTLAPTDESAPANEGEVVLAPDATIIKPPAA